MNVLEHMVDGLVEHLQQYFDILFSEKKKSQILNDFEKYKFLLKFETHKTQQ